MIQEFHNNCITSTRMYKLYTDSPPLSHKSQVTDVPLGYRSIIKYSGKNSFSCKGKEPHKERSPR